MCFTIVIMVLSERLLVYMHVALGMQLILMRSPVNVKNIWRQVLSSWQRNTNNHCPCKRSNLICNTDCESDGAPTVNLMRLTSCSWPSQRIAISVPIPYGNLRIGKGWANVSG